MLDYNLGILALLSFNFLTAAKGVFLGSFLQKISPFIVLSLCFGLVTLIFIVLNLLKGKSKDRVKAFPVLKKHWRLVLGLNVSAVLGWGGYFYALKLIEPAIVVSFTQGGGPIITAIYYFIFHKNVKVSKLEWCFHAISCCILIFLVLVSSMGLSAIGPISNQSIFLGTIAALACGIANVTNTILTKTLNNEGLKPSQIIPARFYLLMLLGVLLVPSTMWHSLGDSQFSFSILIIALAGVAIPIYLVQVGIQKTNPTVVALTMASLPIFMLACQFFDNRLTASIYSVLGSFAIAVIYMISLIVKSSPQIAIKKPIYNEETVRG